MTHFVGTCWHDVGCNIGMGTAGFSLLVAIVR
jgi:hypothetical protein